LDIYILLAAAVLFTIIGAFSILNFGGEPNKVIAGINYILYAVIGSIVAFLTKTIPSIAKAIIGAS
jgi:hypothetical protein